jgi:ADP-dependent NAD(P)H-hydrate dehydratase / NAD(P)H-hydrate epimerase
MKIFKAEQIRAIDAATIKLESVSSIDLMERAAGKLFDWISANVPITKTVLVFAGQGNNGGDALVVARLMLKSGYNITTFIVESGKSCSNEFSVNLSRLSETGSRTISLSEISALPEIESDAVIIDGIFGSGLSRPPSGIFAEVIRKINTSGAMVISIDMPSGLSCDGIIPTDPETIVKADITLSFQFPKLAFMFEEYCRYAGDWLILDIGLLPDAIENENTPYKYITANEVAPLIKQRNRFDHKGIFGHALIVAGSYGKAGAAILACKAALHTGAGLVTCHSPAECVIPLQCSIPETMVSPDQAKDHITSFPDLSAYNAIGVGPGIGTNPDTRRVLAGILTSFRKPLVIDADALNILSMDTEMFSLIPENSVLTPHPGEFARLTGKKETGLASLKSQVEFAGRHKCIVLVKGAYTSIAMPDGRVFFNSTGNPGMATAGSGDVLTGMITSLIAQGYTPGDAAITGAYIHGLAGDIASQQCSMQALVAGDIVKNIGRAYMKIALDAV